MTGSTALDSLDIRRLVRQLIASAAAIRDVHLGQDSGCTDDDITNLMRAQNVASIPAAYDEFLRLAGRNPGADRLFPGSGISYPYVVDAKSVAQDIISESGIRLSLDDQCVVICVHQGYSFLALSTDHPDPPVLLGTEGQRDIRVVGLAFTAWLKHELVPTDESQTAEPRTD